MQTFLPYPDFAHSLSILDYRRLGKQRVEAKQLLSAIGYDPGEGPIGTMLGVRGGWANHPAAVMWRKYPEALVLYHDLCIQEWVKRGYKNTMQLIRPIDATRIWVNPWWLGDEKFHASHRSNLLRKDPVWYGQFNWSEPTDLPYVWPSEYKPHV